MAQLEKHSQEDLKATIRKLVDELLAEDIEINEVVNRVAVTEDEPEGEWRVFRKSPFCELSISYKKGDICQKTV